MCLRGVPKMFHQRNMMYVFKENPYMALKKQPNSRYILGGFIGGVTGLCFANFLLSDVKTTNISDLAYKSFTLVTYTAMGGMCGVALTPATPGLVAIAATYRLFENVLKE
jgi:hypothetical protein